MADYPRIPTFKTAAQFRAHLAEIGADIEIDDSILAAPESPLAQPAEYHGHRIGNRWCILPMEGWDCLPDGSPSELTRRRWLHFAASGAKSSRNAFNGASQISRICRSTAIYSASFDGK